jgi:hypothetical protein
MTDLTREQFRAAVVAAISSVHHLYREVDRLVLSLREALSEEPNPLVAMRGLSGKSGKDPFRLIVRHEYGMLFGPRLEEEDDGEEDDEDEDEEEAEDEGQEDLAESPRSRSKGREISADQPLLAVRIAMYDAQKADAFEPQIEYGLMHHWSVGSVRASPGQVLVMQPRMLRLIPRALGTSLGVKPGGEIRTGATIKRVTGGARRAKDRRLGCVLPLGVKTVPLYELDTATALRTVADQMKQMWSQTATQRV